MPFFLLSLLPYPISSEADDLTFQRWLGSPQASAHCTYLQTQLGHQEARELGAKCQKRGRTRYDPFYQGPSKLSSSRKYTSNVHLGQLSG